MRLHCFGNSHVWSLIGGFGKSDERIESSDRDLEFVGWKLGGSGATAYGLLKHGSVTDAGDNVHRHLDDEPGRKDVVMVFGEVDVSSHIGRHGEPDEVEAGKAVDRYVQYLDRVKGRPDVGDVFVTSVVPHSRRFHDEDGPRIRRVCTLWNSLLRDACLAHDLEYVDWYDCLDDLDGLHDGVVADGFARNPNDPGECHLGPAATPVLVSQVRAAVYRLDQ